jgi:glucose-6-phosphate isomerase
MKFNPEFDIRPILNPMDFHYGTGVFGQPVENRELDDIRQILGNPACEGPETVYSIAMDVAIPGHVNNSNLLN